MIFNVDNNGYSILHTLFKDALISKNGFVKYYWKKSKEQKKESYENLTEPEYQSLLADAEVEIVEVEDGNKEVDVDNMDYNTMTYNVKVKRVKDYGRVVIENVPPDKSDIANLLELALLDRSIIDFSTSAFDNFSTFRIIGTTNPFSEPMATPTSK